jgi:ATP-dependent DNA helicase RecQ
MHQTKDLLKSVFGFDAFRPGQEEVVSAILAGRDVLAIMPTGGGKSLCYQLPALRNEGLTVVISPLIALMRDQVAALREAGVEAGALNSANDPWETERVFEALEGGKLRLLYMAPERLSSEASIRQPMGSRLPPRLPAHRAPTRGSGRRTDRRLHRHRRRRDPRRHPVAPVSRTARSLPARLRQARALPRV